MEVNSGAVENQVKNETFEKKDSSFDVGKKKKKGKRSMFVPRFGCLRTTETDESGNFDMEVVCDGVSHHPTHLIVMVNGLIGSAHNWKYAAKQFLEMYPRDVIVHCSECNSSTLTFDGVDVMGERLAEEVMSVVKRHPNVQKISFIGHSLGGLVARYAIARLYEESTSDEDSQENGRGENNDSEDPGVQGNLEGKIAGLEPMNFITSATPHLGTRGHKQVPAFCGLHALEKAAARTSWCLGRTGKHLFLTDGGTGKPPLLLQMVDDCEDLKFIYALQSFRRRVAYANVHFDHLVGWCTSSLRRRNELPKLQCLSRNDKYPHIINVEAATSTSFGEEDSLDATINGCDTFRMEEEMIRRLTKLSWERVDVNFRGSKQRFLAHSTIQVKNYCINSDGADVIQHMVDNFVL